MTKMNRYARPTLVVAALIALADPLSAQTSEPIEGAPFFSAAQSVTQDSLRAHAYTGPVLSLARIQGTEDFFSAGTDGFLVLHRQTGTPEGWQISDLPVRKVAVHPDGNLVAAYESDGFSVYRVSVWDWAEKKRLYAKRFHDSVISLSWSAKGNYLFAGNTSIEGITTFEAQTGNVKSIFRKAPGIVSLTLTGASESSMMTFGPSGSILYTDIASGTTKASYTAIADIQNPVALNNSLKIAGVGNSAVVLSDAMSGKMEMSYPVAGSVVLATGLADKAPSWFEKSAGNAWKLIVGNISSSDFVLPDEASVVSAMELTDRLVVGTSAGNVFSCKRISLPEESVSFTLAYPSTRLPINDITTDGNRAFILASGSVFISSGPGKAPVFAFTGIDADRIAIYDNALLCWSSRKGMPLTQISFDGENRTVLYQPKDEIQNLVTHGTSISFVDGKSQAVMIVGSNREKTFVYSGVGLQDAIPVSTDKILVSKSATTRTPYPLMLINTITGETVPIPIKANLCFGLTFSGTEREKLQAFLVHAEGTTTTDLVTMYVDTEVPASTIAKTEVTYQDEDLRASVIAANGALITNLGKTALIAIEPETGKQTPLERGYALPAKIAHMDQFVMTLNTDGSLTWYRADDYGRIGDAALTTTGYWIEGK